MPRIVVLDAHTLNPGDLSWQPLGELGELVVHARTTPAELAERVAGADILLTNKTKLDDHALSLSPTLKGVVVLATGVNVVDVEAARRRGVPVCNAPGYGTASVVEHTFALLFELCRAVGQHERATRAGEWSLNPDFCFWKSPQRELAGLHFGVVGFGSIGRKVANVALALGMQVLATPSRRSAEPGVRTLELEALLREADVVSLHCPLTPATEALVRWERLTTMKPSALLLNTARGALVREADLAAALQQGVIAGAALDVLSVEPPPPDHPLLHAPNCLVTPHLAWTTLAARKRLLQITLDNVRGILQGHPLNVVNVPNPLPSSPLASSVVEGGD